MGGTGNVGYGTDVWLESRNELPDGNYEGWPRERWMDGCREGRVKAAGEAERIIA
jgi:hypothetical protein